MMVIDPISLTASGAIGTGGTPAFGGAIGTGGATGSGGAAGTGGRTAAASWVGTWSAAPQLTELANLPPASLSNSTLRQIVHVTLGGSQLRVRFSNEFGNGPLTIHSAHVAVCRAIPVDSSIDTATDKALILGKRVRHDRAGRGHLVRPRRSRTGATWQPVSDRRFRQHAERRHRSPGIANHLLPANR
jgi:hypothetical protein